MNIKKHLILATTVFLLAACTGTEKNAGGETTDSGSIGAGVANLFGALGSSQGSESPTLALVSFDPCVVEDFQGDISMTGAIKAGHYGRMAEGLTVEAGFECDSSKTETTFLSWEFINPKVMECTSGNLTFDGGSGIVQLLMDGENLSTTGKVYGSFTVGDVTANCDIIFTDETFTAECDGDNGNPLSGGEEDVSCSEPATTE